MANVKKTALQIGRTQHWVSACSVSEYKRPGTGEKMYLTSDYSPDFVSAHRMVGNTRGTAEYLIGVRDMLNIYSSRAAAVKAAKCPTNYATVSAEDRREGRFDASRRRRRR